MLADGIFDAIAEIDGRENAFVLSETKVSDCHLESYVF